MSANVMQLVDRKIDLWDDLQAKMNDNQNTADFFTLADRRELLKQGIQLEQVLRDLSDAKLTAKEVLKDHLFIQDSHEKRLRTLEDNQLRVQTQIKTSRWWIAIISAGASAIVSLALKLLLGK